MPYLNSAGGQGSRGARGQGGRGEKKFPSAPLLLCSPALLFPFLAGLFLGWNIATRYAEALFVPVFGLLLLYYLLNVERLTFNVQHFTFNVLPPLLAFSAPILAIGLALIYFNLSRYGDPFNTGYLPNETFSGVLWQGLFGQLLSPGRGLFLYCPIFLLSLVGFPAFFRRFRPEAIMALSVIVIHLFLYGKWFMWHGGYAWGPRFMVPTLPFWAIFLAPVVAQAFPETRRGEDTGGGEEKEKNLSPHHLTASSSLRLIFLILATLGLIPQLLSVAIDFTPFQNSLLEAGLPLFDSQTFFDPQYSPFGGAWAFITADSLDLAWAWRGHINGWLLVVLMINIALTAINLRASELANQRIPRGGYALANGDKARQMGSGWGGSGRLTISFIHAISIICPLSTMSAVTFLLAHAHSLPAPSLTQAVAALNEGVRPNDAVITNDPDSAMPFAELYKGRAPVLGLQSGNFPLPGDVVRRLNETMANHQQIWWLPNWIPPEQSAIEQTLMMRGFRARNDNFEGERLVLFAFPPNLVANIITTEAIFGNQIKLVDVAYPLQASAGAALPIQLNWQALTKLAQDYHVFIHLVAEDGQMVAQADGQPALWLRPTTTWVIGETIVDRHGLWLPTQTARGVYELRVGLYRPVAGQRLRLTTGEEWASLTVTVQ